jgi:selenoprotein W-related protein
LTDTIFAEYSDGIDAVELVPGSGGVFEVSFDGDLVFSKARERRFPEDDEILGPLRERL